MIGDTEIPADTEQRARQLVGEAGDMIALGLAIDGHCTSFGDLDALLHELVDEVMQEKRRAAAARRRAQRDRLHVIRGGAT